MNVGGGALGSVVVVVVVLVVALVPLVVVPPPPSSRFPGRSRSSRPVTASAYCLASARRSPRSPTVGSGLRSPARHPMYPPTSGSLGPSCALDAAEPPRSNVTTTSPSPPWTGCKSAGGARSRRWVLPAPPEAGASEAPHPGTTPPRPRTCTPTTPTTHHHKPPPKIPTRPQATGDQAVPSSWRRQYEATHFSGALCTAPDLLVASSPCRSIKTRSSTS